MLPSAGTDHLSSKPVPEYKPYLGICRRLIKFQTGVSEVNHVRCCICPWRVVYFLHPTHKVVLQMSLCCWGKIKQTQLKETLQDRWILSEGPSMPTTKQPWKGNGCPALQIQPRAGVKSRNSSQATALWAPRNTSGKWGNSPEQGTY